MKTIQLNNLREVPENYTGIVAFSNRTKFWFKEGKIHREDGPAKEFTGGYKEWWIEGNLHRIDGPAIEYPDGTKYWYKEGEKHRVDGPAIEVANGEKYWYIDHKEYDKTMLEKIVFLGEEKGRYGLNWLRLFTETGIKEFPIIPGMENDIELWAKIKEIKNEQERVF